MEQFESEKTVQKLAMCETRSILCLTLKLAGSTICKGLQRLSKIQTRWERGWWKTKIQGYMSHILTKKRDVYINSNTITMSITIISD